MGRGRPAERAWASPEAAREKARDLMREPCYSVACNVLFALAQAHREQLDRDELRELRAAIRKAIRATAAKREFGPLADARGDAEKRLKALGPGPSDAPRKMIGRPFRRAFLGALLDSMSGVLDPEAMAQVFKPAALAYFAIGHRLAQPAADKFTSEEQLTASQVFKREHCKEWRDALRDVLQDVKARSERASVWPARRILVGKG